MQKNNEFNFNFHNTYMNLPNSFYSEIGLSKVPNPEFIIFNDKLAKDLNLSISSLQSKEGLEILAGNTKAKYGSYIAQDYGGHQFGHFSILGDGRALLIGEHNVDNPIDITLINSNKFDIQLKGSGKTPYSRRGDGKAVLGPMLREYIISEAMYNLGIPTTRSLAVVKTGEKVYRETIKQGAILTRI
ncbi:MAG: YdiU family protein, partial [Clostridium sp.]|nr:YdiU family protein [Clostridium sp.]